MGQWKIQQQIGKWFSLCSSLPKEPIPLFQVLETFCEVDAEAISALTQSNLTKTGKDILLSFVDHKNPKS